jgi:hypothetical protein
MGAVNRPVTPIETFTEIGNYVAAYPSDTTIQIDLFTKGKFVEIDENNNYYENTAVADMLNLLNYLDSPATVNWCALNDISLFRQGAVSDVSEIVNDTQWQYRAFAELHVGFTDWTAEYQGVLSDNAIVFDENDEPVSVDNTVWEETDAGGGTEKLAKEETGYFEQVAEIQSD